jgi:hypothetical protein
MSGEPVIRMDMQSCMVLTHNASALVLPGGSDLVTAKGDTAWFWIEKPGDPESVAILVKYQTANGKVIWPSHYHGA